MSKWNCCKQKVLKVLLCYFGVKSCSACQGSVNVWSPWCRLSVGRLLLFHTVLSPPFMVVWMHTQRCQARRDVVPLCCIHILLLDQTFSFQPVNAGHSAARNAVGPYPAKREKESGGNNLGHKMMDSCEALGFNMLKKKNRPLDQPDVVAVGVVQQFPRMWVMARSSAVYMSKSPRAR